MDMGLQHTVKPLWPVHVQGHRETTPSSRKRFRRTGPVTTKFLRLDRLQQWPDGPSLHDTFLYLDLPSDFSGPDTKRRISGVRSIACRSPQGNNDMQKYLPANVKMYELNSWLYAAKSPPYHVTTDKIPASIGHLEVEQISGHQLARCRGGGLALYETHWRGLLTLSGNANPTFKTAGINLFSAERATPITIAKPTASTVKCGSTRRNADCPGQNAIVS